MNLFRLIFTISRNTFREAIRDRVLYNLIVFVLLITACAIFLGELTAGQEARTIVNVGLAAVLFFGVFIAIFVGVGLVSKEIEKKTLYTIFSKPIGRGEFILGKFFGLSLTLLVNIVVMGCGISLALVYVGGASLIGSVWASILLILFELMVITAIAMLFSSFSSPALSALLTFLVFIIGHFSTSLRELSLSLKSSFARFFFDAIYYVLPNFSNYEFATNASHGELPSASYVLMVFIYTAVYIALVLTVTIFIFSKRNLK